MLRFYICFSRAQRVIAFPPPTSQTATMRMKGVLLQERKTGVWRRAVLRLVCPEQQKGGLYRCAQVIDSCSKNWKGGGIFKLAGG